MKVRGRSVGRSLGGYGVGDNLLRPETRLKIKRLTRQFNDSFASKDPIRIPKESRKDPKRIP